MRLAVLVVSLLSTAAFAEGAAGVTWKAPTAWQASHGRPMRVVTYKIAAREGEPGPVELAVYFFGAGQGGTVKANVDRWIHLFRTANGEPPENIAHVFHQKIHGLKVTLLLIQGTYLGGMGPMMPTGTEVMKDWGMMGAIVEAPEGLVFFKMTGPERTMERTHRELGRMLETLRKDAKAH